MDILRKNIELKSNLKTSDIFKIMQDVSAEHCAKYKLSMADLDKKGLIWVVVRQFVAVERYPEKGESLDVKTWPGATRHMMFPRFYIIKDEKGNVVIKGSAIWTMVDRESRKMISPQSYGLGLEGLVTGEECHLPSGVKRQKLQRKSSFTVPEEYIDSNKHMNNTRYYDAVENCLEAELSGKKLKEALTEYVSEAVLDETVNVLWDKIDGRFFVDGEKDGTVFKMNLLYE